MSNNELFLLYNIVILEFFGEDWSPIPTLNCHSLVYTALQGKFDATHTWKRATLGDPSTVVHFN
jgi:hypothetical protein